MTDLFAANLAALAKRSPETAAQIGPPSGDSRFRPALAASGEAIVEFDRRPLESRRSPRDAARRQAADVSAPRAAVIGFGAGYLVEALQETGHEVAAIVESEPAALAAALDARDLTALLENVPVVLAQALADPVELVLFKRMATSVVPLGARVAMDDRLARLVAAWPAIPAVGRRPRILVAGPLGGDAAAARSTACALAQAGAETAFADFSSFASGWSSIESMMLPPDGKETVKAGLAGVLGDAVVRQAAALQADLVLAIGRPILGPCDLRRLREQGQRTACWFTENWRLVPAWERLAPGCDAFFAVQGGPFLEAVRSAGAGKAVYLPNACDPARHAPVALSSEEQSRYGAAVGFVGTPSLNRRRVLAAVADFDLKVWGEGWGKTELAAAATPRTLSQDESLRVFAASGINLNIHSAPHVEGLDPEPDYLDARTFELASCGAFQLVDARHPLRAAFAPDEVVSFASLPELREQIGHFIAHSEERRAIAARARSRAVRQHTFAHRARAILRETFPPEAVAAASLPPTDRLSEAVARLEAAHRSMGPDEALLRILLALGGQS